MPVHATATSQAWNLPWRQTHAYTHLVTERELASNSPTGIKHAAYDVVRATVAIVAGRAVRRTAAAASRAKRGIQHAAGASD
eukprot:16705-Chlamydomonas_euryale.AAC.1